MKLKKEPVSAKKKDSYLKSLTKKYNITEEEASYFVFKGKVTDLAYNTNLENINILHKNGKISDVAKASDQLNLDALSKPVVKYYICYPKQKD